MRDSDIGSGSHDDRGSGEGRADHSELLEAGATGHVSNERFRVTFGDSFAKSVSASVAPLLGQQELLSKNVAALIAPTLMWQTTFGNSFARALSISDTLGRWASDFLKDFPNLADLRRGLFPANLFAVENIELDQCEQFMLDEGLPIAWVPRPATLEAIFSAPTAAARRAVYGSRWRGITTDCEVLLNSMKSAQTAPYVGYALKSAQGLREGHHELSQAFTATTLDSLLQKVLVPPLRKDVLGPKRFDSEGFTSRQFFAFSQLWGIHRPYFPSAGDRVPLSFNRHGSVHGVSRRQYSRINAVIGLAHLTSFLWFVDTTYTRRRAT